MSQPGSLGEKHQQEGVCNSRRSMDLCGFQADQYMSNEMNNSIMNILRNFDLLYSLCRHADTCLYTSWDGGFSSKEGHGHEHHRSGFPGQSSP